MTTRNYELVLERVYGRLQESPRTRRQLIKDLGITAYALGKARALDAAGGRHLRSEVRLSSRGFEYMVWIYAEVAPEPVAVVETFPRVTEWRSPTLQSAWDRF